MVLDDLEHKVRDGIHIASLAGAWTALVAGFGGMRGYNGVLSFSPRLPEGITRLAFHTLFCDQRVRVEVTATEATYRLIQGSSLKIQHHGDEITLSGEKAVTRSIPPIKAGPRPAQPHGHVPTPRGIRRSS